MHVCMYVYKDIYNTLWAWTSRKTCTVELYQCMCIIYNIINKYKGPRINPNKICAQYYGNTVQSFSKTFERPE